MAQDPTNAIVARLESDWPRWQIWTVRRAVGGTTWCARRWDDERQVLNADCPEKLVELLEEASQ